jgi:predicted Holliday junction resolvase-like endonuclease
MDEFTKEEERLDRLEEELRKKEEELRRKARQKGRQLAQLIARKIDPVFTPRKLNPDDAKVLFHPVDFIVFNGMKENKLKNILLLERHRGSDLALQESIRKTIERERYEWQTLRISEEGKIIVE